jgi:hypothetical protein
MQYKQERLINERYSTNRGSLNNRLLPCPVCDEPGQLTAPEIIAGKKCDECVREDGPIAVLEENND